MQGKYRTDTKTKSKTRFFLLLTVVFLIVLFKWLVPAMFNVLSSSGNDVKPAKAEKDIIPPQMPFFSALPEATNSSQTYIQGYTEANVNLEIYVNENNPIKDISDKDGNFKVGIKLSQGKNKILVKAIDLSGNSSQSEAKYIELDTKPIELSISSPADGAEIFGRDNQTTEIKGKVNKPEINILVNNSFTTSDKDGNFVFRLSLAQGENKIKIMATDKAGNIAEREMKVTFSL